MRYDKDYIKEQLTTDMVFEIVDELGGRPRKTDFGFISATICHNHFGEGSHKLYYYENTALFRCYTGCDSYFDIFELIKKIQHLKDLTEWTLYDSVRWVASRFGWGPTVSDDVSVSGLSDWKLIEKYDKIQLVKDTPNILLPEYDKSILDHLAYPNIEDWTKEGISREVQKANRIGYYPPGEQITIPHFDILGRFIGLRGRSLSIEDAAKYGKYRPLVVGNTMYNHPLGLNLYNINNSAPQIKRTKKAIVYEGEKSALQYQSYFGRENDISVACCGSSISSVQMSLLLGLGASEIIIAFDRQFKEKNDDEFKHLVRNLKTIKTKYGQYAIISFIFDTENLLPYKASPIDCGPEIFLKMFKKRIIL